MDLSKLTIEELSRYESVTRILCGRYENAIKNYTGTFGGADHDTLEKFELYSKKYQKIIDEIEKRVENL